MKIVLVGQPNSGKSTIFNSIAGIKAISSNFPGTTVKYTLSRVRIFNRTCECVDLPGTYSLTSLDLAERETLRFLTEEPVDVIINVIDASLLGRSLELTLQLLELQVPLVICLNMIDEARRKGLTIDARKLSELLGVPVVQTQATAGIGLQELFRTAVMAAENPPPRTHMEFHRDIEEVVRAVSTFVQKRCLSGVNLPPRFVALRLLEGDPAITRWMGKRKPECLSFIREQQKNLEKSHGVSAETVIAAERHAAAHRIYQQVVKIQHYKPRWRDHVDRVIMHPFWGYFFLILIFYGFFFLVFQVGKSIEEPLLDLFAGLSRMVAAHLGEQGLLTQLLDGLIQGIAGGIGIVLPYLLPFLLGLSFLEDVGYLPRVAFFMDAFMHKIGLHGKAIIPFIIGYGCNVPAIMATRILDSPRDRVVASVLATMVPCSARTTVILGLVAFYLGPAAALSIYFLNILVIAISGKILSRRLPESSPGLILEIPPFRLPAWRVLLLKTWLRLREFIVLAWPILIAGSILLSLISYWHIDQVLNTLLSPLTYVMGLPKKVATVLIFGILRKELSLIMLLQALGTVHPLQVLSAGQIMTFTVFVVFYFPCLATLSALIKEIGLRWAVFAVLFTTGLALVLAVLVRWGLFLVGIT